MAAFLVGILVWLSRPPQIFAQSAHACELELVLAVDVSGSIDSDEYAIQMRGLADAFRSLDIIHLIASASRKGDVYATVVQWSGRPHQAQVVPWSRLADEESILAFADAIAASPREFLNYSTAIGSALSFSRAMFAMRSAGCRRRVIDVSGDGPNNAPGPTKHGTSPPGAVADIRAQLVRENVTINGLVVLGDHPTLGSYYRHNVIGGNGAFVITADTFKDYPDAIRRKLLREIAPPITFAPQGRPKVTLILPNCSTTEC